MRRKPYWGIILVCGVGLLGCKSQDEHVAMALDEKILAPIVAATPTADRPGDPVLWGELCLASVTVLQGEDVKAFTADKSSQTSKAVERIKKACEGAPELPELVKREMARQREPRSASPDAAGHSSGTRIDAGATGR